MAGPLALLVPIIMTGARVITRVAPQIAKRLLNQGKAKRPDAVIKDLEKAIETKTVKGRTAVIKAGSRSVVSGPTKEASKLIKTGQAQRAKTVLNSLKKEYGKISKEAKPVSEKTPKPKPWDFKQPQQPYEHLVKEGRLPGPPKKTTVKKAGGGQIKKYKEGKMIGPTKVLPRPVIKKPWGAAIKGKGKGYK